MHPFPIPIKKMMPFLRRFLFVIMLQSFNCSASSTTPDFQGYWAQFRTASLTNDYAALANLTRFPLEVEDVVDGIPVATYGENDLNKIFPKIMSQTVYQPQGDELLETTMEEILRKKEKATFDTAATEVRIAQFQFNVINGKWLLVRAYLEE